MSSPKHSPPHSPQETEAKRFKTEEINEVDVPIPSSSSSPMENVEQPIVPPNERFDTFWNFEDPRFVISHDLIRKTQLDSLENVPETLGPLPRPRVTGLVYDTRCLHHLDLFSNVEREGEHPERALRIKTAHQVLEREGLVARCKAIPVVELGHDEPGKEEEDNVLGAIHGMDHVERMRKMTEMDRDGLKEFSRGFNSVYLSAETHQAALVSAGGVVAACRSVMRGQCDNALALVRPPGHHAEKHEAMGFCVFNNVGVAIADVKKEWQGKGRGPNGDLKVIVVDWDVHHGNGIQQLFADDPNVLYISLHRYDSRSFYPNFLSACAYYTGIGKGRGFNVNIPWQTSNQGGVGDPEYMHAFERIVMPIGREFDPDLVIVAAGFDAARGDPIGGCDLTPRGYAQMTHMLSGLAGGRVVVALEGGYNPTSVALSLSAVVSILLGDPVPRLASQGQRAVPPANHAYETVELVRRIHSRYWSSLLPKAGIESDLTIMASDWNWSQLAKEFRNIAREEQRDQKRRYVAMMMRMGWSLPEDVSGTVLEETSDEDGDPDDPLARHLDDSRPPGAVEELWDLFGGSTVNLSSLVALHKAQTMKSLGFSEFELDVLLDDVLKARWHGSVWYRDPFGIWEETLGPSKFHKNPEHAPESLKVIFVVHEAGSLRGDSSLYDNTLISSTSQLFDPSIPFHRDLQRLFRDHSCAVVDICIDYETMSSRTTGFSMSMVKETIEEGIGGPLWDAFMTPLMQREGIANRVTGVGFVGVGQGSELVSWWACHQDVQNLCKRQAIALIPPPSHAPNAIPRVPPQKAQWWKDNSLVVVSPHPTQVWTEIEVNMPEFGGLVSGGGVVTPNGPKDYFYGYEQLQPPVALELSMDSWTLFARFRTKLSKWLLKRLKIVKDRRPSGWQDEESLDWQSKLQELQSRGVLGKTRIEPAWQAMVEDEEPDFPVSSRRYVSAPPAGGEDEEVEVMVELGENAALGWVEEHE